MASQLAWLDHDSAAKDRMQRILALLKDKEARDELGLGTVRDSIADKLFPGTSTIQTRLRYMLFVPWIYGRLEEQGVSSAEVEKRARNLEVRLVAPLLAQEDQAGVFGKLAKGEIKRLPSSVYWAGLRSWGIFTLERSRDEYHRMFDAVVRARRARVQAATDGPVTARVDTWHPTLPPAPEDFPDAVSLSLTREEAEWIRERIKEAHSETLLAFLADHDPIGEVDAPWVFVTQRTLSAHNRTLLVHGQRFSSAMYGAALAYNYALAILPDSSGKPRRPELASELAESVRHWVHGLDLADLREWSLSEFWSLVRSEGHVVTDGAQKFISTWVDIARRGSFDTAIAPSSLKLVELRERALKDTRSRFVNRRAYDEWGGAAGAAPMTFRWRTVQTLMRDLHDGLARR